MAPAPPVRVLHVCAVDFTVRQFIAPLCMELSRSGYDVQAACTPGPHWDELRTMGMRMIPLPLARSANPVRAMGAVWRLYKILRRERIDILHVHTPVASMIGRLAGKLAGVPLIVYTAHGFYFHDRMSRAKRLLHIGLERAFGLLTDAIFCVSSEDARLAKSLRLAPCGHVFHTGNGVDTERFSPAVYTAKRDALRAQFGLPTDGVVITIMGRLVREKGYREFFQAAQRLASDHANVHFMVVGDTVTSEHDDAKAMILEMAAAPELKDRVHFMGMRSDIPELLASSDIFTLPSYREGLPVSILEAMAMELPVVATAIRGCREEVVDGLTGFLVEPQDSVALGRALEFLVSDRVTAAKMGAKGRREVLQRFDERRIFARQLRIYRALSRKLAR